MDTKSCAEREPAADRTAAAPQPAHLRGGHPLVKQPQATHLLVNCTGQQTLQQKKCCINKIFYGFFHFIFQTIHRSIQVFVKLVNWLYDTVSVHK